MQTAGIESVVKSAHEKWLAEGRIVERQSIIKLLRGKVSDEDSSYRRVLLENLIIELSDGLAGQQCG